MRDKHNLQQQTQEVITHIIHDITHSPGGYSWWIGLPEKGKKSQHATKKRWGRLIRQNLFTVSLVNAMILACFDRHGIINPQCKMLHSLVMKMFFGGNEITLYQRWCKIKQGIDYDSD